MAGPKWNHYGAGHTAEGGICVKVKNRTGAPTIKGLVVCACPAEDGAVVVAQASSVVPIGVVYDSGVPDGGFATIVIDGVADVLLQSSSVSTSGNWVGVSATEAGRADATNGIPPGLPERDSKLGFSLETIATGGPLVVCRVLLRI
jgi:hypothetical protein